MMNVKTHINPNDPKIEKIDPKRNVKTRTASNQSAGGAVLAAEFFQTIIPIFPPVQY
jgi:hypothetical protein